METPPTASDCVNAREAAFAPSLPFYRTLIFMQIALLASVSAKLLATPLAEAESLGVDPGTLRAVGIAHTAVVLGGLLYLLRTWWRPGPTAWWGLARYFVMTGVVLMVMDLTLRNLLPTTSLAGAFRLEGATGFLMTQFFAGLLAAYGVKHGIWEQRWPPSSRPFR